MATAVIATPPALSWSITDLHDLDLDELLEVFEETFESWHRPPTKPCDSRVAGNLADERGMSVDGRVERVAGIRSTRTLLSAAGASRAAETGLNASSRPVQNTHLSSIRPPRDANTEASTQSRLGGSDASSLSDIDLDPAIQAFLGPRRPSHSLAAASPRAPMPIPMHFAALDDFFVSARTSYFPDVPHEDVPTTTLAAGLPQPQPATELFEPLSPLPPRPETRASTIRHRVQSDSGLGSAEDHDAVSFISNSSSNRTIKTTTFGSGSTGSQSYAPLAMYPRPPPSKASKSAIYPKPPPPLLPDVEEKRTQVPPSVGKTSLGLRWRKVERW